MKKYLNNFSSIDESNTVIIVFFHASGDRQNVWIKNHVVWREADSVDEDFVRPRANFHFPLHVCCLYTETTIYKDSHLKQLTHKST